jgi:acetyl esterase/lipase
MALARSRFLRFLVRTWPLLGALALLTAMPVLLSYNRNGRVAVEASIFLPDMVLQVPLPFRPVDLISDAPKRERVTIDYESRNGPRSIEADVYTPAHGATHVGVVFSMGAPPLALDDPRLVRIAEDSARSGVVMLMPFSDRLDELRIEPEEIDALVAEFQYVQRLPRVDAKRVGFFGASVGGSLALVAAADPRIADDVDHVVSFGGYFDALTALGAIATDHIQYKDVDQKWKPSYHAHRVAALQIIDRLDDAGERDLLARIFVDPYFDADDYNTGRGHIDGQPPSPEELAGLSPVARSSYNFLANRDPGAVADLIRTLLPAAVTELDYLSPKTSIDRVKAELFILHDRGDPVIPYTESRRLKDALGDRARAHFDELRLFEHVKPKLNQEPDIIALDSTRLLFRLYQLLLRWD